jgi:hypothetical protein
MNLNDELIELARDLHLKGDGHSAELINKAVIKLAIYNKIVALECSECDVKHQDLNSFCSNCKACLYKNSEQALDYTYPLFRCLKCKTINFWD